MISFKKINFSLRELLQVDSGLTHSSLEVIAGYLPAGIREANTPTENNMVCCSWSICSLFFKLRNDVARIEIVYD
jgi:hypothetical protein